MDEKLDLEAKWDVAQARLESLMEQLPAIDEKRETLRKSRLGHSIVHRTSRRDSAWEMAGILEQKLTLIEEGTREYDLYKGQLETQKQVVTSEEEAVRSEMAEGGFASLQQARDARLSQEAAEVLELSIETFTLQYEAALRTCEDLDSRMG